MKKRTLSKLKSIFGSKKGKRQKQDSAKSSRSSSPEAGRDESPSGAETGFQPITPPASRVMPTPSPPVPMHPVAPVPPEPSGPLSLTPCPVCGRTFVPQSLSKHVKICEKMTVKKRKTFDSSRQRREGLATPNGGKSGTDLEQYLPKNFGLPENSPFLEKSPPNTAKVALKPKPSSVKTVIAKPSADLQRCPHCNRTFGVRAFERHVEWCADKAKILPAAPAQPPPHIADAKQRLNARTQYKAPLVRGRRSSQSRDKSSNSRSASVESSRGVSPPPPPREFGDNKGRSRASESVSSNDHEEASPHVPVIRNSRISQNNFGDANVKARQARLARDLSSSSNKDPSPDSRPSSIQKYNTDPNVKKNLAKNKVKSILSVKREHQLKKLEEISVKYNERKKNIDAQNKSEKSQIPVRKKLENRKTDSKTIIKMEYPSDSSRDLTKPYSNRGYTSQRKASLPTSMNNDSSERQKNIGKKTPKIVEKPIIESTISLDSLEEPTPISDKDKNCQSVGINTELLCPCVPCIIHNSPDQKLFKKKASKVKKNNATQMTDDPEAKVELLFKNLNIVSSCNIADGFETDSKENLFIANDVSMLTAITLDNCMTDSIEPSKIYYESKSEYSFEPPVIEQIEKKDTQKADAKKELSHNLLKDKIEEEIPNVSTDICEELYEHDLSEEMLDESTDNKYNDYNVNKNEDVMCRHGSGETYTKFTEDPADLEEFMNITDKMMNCNANQLDMDKELDNFRSPNTNSLEWIQNASVDDKLDTTAAKKDIDFDTFEELKSHLKELFVGVHKELLKGAHKAPENICESEENKRNVSDMEHITVYELKIFEKEDAELKSPLKEPIELKLPSIAKTNKPERKIAVTKKRVQNIYNHNSFKMLGDQNKANREYQTFIVKEQDDSDEQSISAEAPPLKLPRIEKKRIDDNYDPFLSAARQMKELMSSDTNLPKKIQNSCKDPNRTLPILRNSKEKPSLSYLRTDNSKMIKDSLNKTYQKTPTLHRMKSFGSTNIENKNYSFSGRCSSFRVNRNEKKSSQKLNSTFTKSSKENISTTEKNYFNRSSNLNRSFSSYTASAYSTPKLKEKIPKISTSLYHSFQRTTIKQPVKLDKIKIEENKTDFVNLDSILAENNSSMTDSNYIDPRLINENDNLPINVNTILNNPDIISSMESLLTTENLPAKYDTLIVKTENNNTECNGNKESLAKLNKIESNNNIIPPVIDNLSLQYDKIMSSLEQSITSKTSIRDDDSLCEDFDLEEFMTNFDDEINKQKAETKRTCSSTTRVVKQSELADSNRTSDLNSFSSSPKVVFNGSNGFIPVNKSMSLNFSSNNIVSESLFPSSVKRSTSLLDSIQKKNVSRTESSKSRQNVDKLEQDIMQSLKEFDKFYEPEKGETTVSKEMNYRHSPLPNGPSKRESRVNNERKSNKKLERVSNGNYTPNGKQSNDSAYSSLNRISPSKLSVCHSKDSNGVTSLEQIPAGSDSSGCQKDEIRSVSSDEFLAMERSAEMDDPLPPVEKHDSYKDHERHHGVNEKRVPSRASSRRSSWRAEALSSSESEASLSRGAPAPAPAPPPRPSRFCHECGARFPVDTAKFCIDCGVRRLVV